jgi:hypothetical protein
MIGPAPFLVFLLPIAFLAIIVLVVAALTRSRGEPDERGRRPLAVYLLVVMFISLFTLVGSVQQIVSTLVDEAVGTPDLPGSFGLGVAQVESSGTIPSEGGSAIPIPHPPGQLTFGPDRSVLAPTLQGLISALLAAGIFAFHARGLRGLLGKEEEVA